MWAGRFYYFWFSFLDFKILDIVKYVLCKTRGELLFGAPPIGGDSWIEERMSEDQSWGSLVEWQWGTPNRKSYMVTARGYSFLLSDQWSLFLQGSVQSHPHGSWLLLCPMGHLGAEHCPTVCSVLHRGQRQEQVNHPKTTHSSWVGIFVYEDLNQA